MPVSPAVLVHTRLAWHALAERVIAPLRVERTGHEIALTVRPGGFGTPDLPGGGWVGVAGTEVVAVDAGGAERRAPLTSLRAAGEHVGLGAAAGLPDDPLDVDAEAAGRLAATYALGAEALAALAATAAADEEPSEAILWPEHFDVAIELGADGARANYGVSPGDDDHDEPYAYVGPWEAPPAGPLWNAVGFPGAELPLDGVNAAVLGAFFAERHAALRG